MHLAGELLTSSMVSTSQQHPTLPILGSLLRTQTLGLEALQAAFLLAHFFIFPLLGFKSSIKDKHKAFTGVSCHVCMCQLDKIK